MKTPSKRKARKAVKKIAANFGTVVPESIKKIAEGVSGVKPGAAPLSMRSTVNQEAREMAFRYLDGAIKALEPIERGSVYAIASKACMTAGVLLGIENDLLYGTGTAEPKGLVSKKKKR